MNLRTRIERLEAKQRTQAGGDAVDWQERALRWQDDPAARLAELEAELEAASDPDARRWAGVALRNARQLAALVELPEVGY